MIQIKIQNLADVPEALELVRGEVEKVKKAINEAGARALCEDRRKVAREALDYADGLDAFIGKIDALGKDWEELEESIEAATPEAQEIVRSAGGTGGVVNPSPEEAAEKSDETYDANKAFPFAVGRVVRAVFPLLQNDPRMTEDAVTMLVDKSSSARFKVGGHPVLKLRTGNPDEIKDSFGHYRYYQNLPLSFFGKKYWLASQFQPHGLLPVLEWLESIGMGRDEVLAICEKRFGTPAKN